MKSIRIRILLVIIIFALCGSFIICRLIKASKINAIAAANDQCCYNEKFNAEDSLLFRTSTFKNLESIFTIKSTYRNDIKCVGYGNSCKIYYTRIDLSKDIPMDQFILFREEFTKLTTMHSYRVLSRNNIYDFNVLSEKLPRVDTIIFSLTGNGRLMKRICFNKNFISYYLPVSSFSLRYSEHSPTDIYFGTLKSIFGRGEYPLMLSFYKRRQSFYVILVIPKKNDMNLDADFLGKKLNDNNLE